MMIASNSPCSVQQKRSTDVRGLCEIAVLSLNSTGLELCGERVWVRAGVSSRSRRQA